MSIPKFVNMTKNIPFFPILHVFAPLNDVRAYIAWSWKTTLITWIFLRGWYPTSDTSGPPGTSGYRTQLSFWYRCAGIWNWPLLYLESFGEPNKCCLVNYYHFFFCPIWGFGIELVKKKKKKKKKKWFHVKVGFWGTETSWNGSQITIGTGLRLGISVPLSHFHPGLGCILTSLICDHDNA